METALYRMGEDWDAMRVDYALRQHEQWYVGDGAYSDGWTAKCIWSGGHVPVDRAIYD